MALTLRPPTRMRAVTSSIGAGANGLCGSLPLRRAFITVSRRTLAGRVAAGPPDAAQPPGKAAAARDRVAELAHAVDRPEVAVGQEHEHVPARADLRPDRREEAVVVWVVSAHPPLPCRSPASYAPA